MVLTIEQLEGEFGGQAKGVASFHIPQAGEWCEAEWSANMFKWVVRVKVMSM